MDPQTLKKRGSLQRTARQAVRKDRTFSVPCFLDIPVLIPPPKKSMHPLFLCQQLTMWYSATRLMRWRRLRIGRDCRWV